MWESIGLVFWSLFMLGGGFIAGLIWVGDNCNCDDDNDDDFIGDNY